MLDIFELDDMGIVPFSNEPEITFIKRGNVTIDVMNKKTDEELIEFIKKVDTEIKLSFFCHSQEQRIKDIEYIQKKYGVNLSWVRFLSMEPIVHCNELGKHIYTSVGRCRIGLISIENISICHPIIFISEPSFICHELLHAARATCVSSNTRNKDFEEFIAKNYYFLSHRFNICRNKQLFYKIKRKLQKYFGEKHGYVFIRLTYREITSQINKPLDNPIRYIRAMADVSLKHRIMCEKLDLWKYDCL